MILTRPPVEDEHRFIEAAWINHYQKSASRGTIPNHLFWEAYLPTVRFLMQRPGATTLVAAFEEVPDLVLGFIVSEDGFTRDGRLVPCLHYCFVKTAYRGQGVAKELFNAAGLSISGPFLYTFQTSRLERQTSPRIVHRPELARRHKIGTPHPVSDRERHADSGGGDAEGVRPRTRPPQRGLHGVESEGPGSGHGLPKPRHG